MGNYHRQAVGYIGMVHIMTNWDGTNVSLASQDDDGFHWPVGIGSHWLDGEGKIR